VTGWTCPVARHARHVDPVSDLRNRVVLLDGGLYPQ
jgi:hypothetical protein